MTKQQPDSEFQSWQNSHCLKKVSTEGKMATEQTHFGVAFHVHLLDQGL